MNQPDLAHIATEELYEEIKRRTDASLLVTYKDRDAFHTETVVCFGGGVPVAMGLTQAAALDLERIWNAARDQGGVLEE